MSWRSESLENTVASAVIWLLVGTVGVGGLAAVAAGDEEHRAHPTLRRSNFSNEFGLTTPEGINARGNAFVRSRANWHRVVVRVSGLTPGREFVVLNHWFEPVAARGVGPSLPSDDPSCNGHFQFLGPVPVRASHSGRLYVSDRVGQLAPHIWVVDLAKFLETTGSGTHAPSSPDSFVTGGLLIPFVDLLEEENDFRATDPLTRCD